jgi:hypothetical protein
MLAELVDRRQALACGECDDSVAARVEIGIGSD